MKNEMKKTDGCNGKMEVYSRVVGYIRPVEDWNDAKKDEFDERETYRVGENAH